QRRRRVRRPPRPDRAGPRPDPGRPRRPHPGARHQPVLLAGRRPGRTPAARRGCAMRRRWLVVGAAAALGVLLAPARPASAHPLGNFSVNQYEGLTLRPDRVDVAVVVDTAEIPTLQQKSTV